MSEHPLMDPVEPEPEEAPLAMVKSAAGSVAKRQEFSVEEMFRGVLQLIQSGKLTSEGVQAAGEALKLCERLQAQKAKQEYIQARVAMQPHMKKVIAQHAVPDRNGVTKYKTAKFEEIDDQARPIYNQFGFSVSFTERPREAGLVTKVLILEHIGGHSVEYPYTVRIGGGPTGASDTQADNAAHTSGKRRAFCDALNIVIEQEEEDDETALGNFITADQAKNLKARVQATGTVEVSFLKYAHAPDYEHIYSSRWKELDSWLAKRERVQAQQKGKPAGPAAAATIGRDTAKQLRDRVLATGADWVDFLVPFKVQKFEDLPAASLQQALDKVAALEGQT